MGGGSQGRPYHISGEVEALIAGQAGSSSASSFQPVSLRIPPLVVKPR
jgi:hypothetical protein